MKVLIDMNLSPAWVGVLNEAGVAAVHWAGVGDAAAFDSTIMTYAVRNDFVILTHDLDFGIALAMSRHGKPSVVQIRVEDLGPSTIGIQVVQAFRQMEAELGLGAW
jgi:predicted nuclease of predicted toxin-antitoxin system